LTETPTPLEGSRTKKPPALSLEKKPNKKAPSFEFRKNIKSIPSNLMHDDNNDIKHLRSSKTQKNKNNFQPHNHANITLSPPFV